jgi:spore coat protein H
MSQRWFLLVALGLACVLPRGVAAEQAPAAKGAAEQTDALFADGRVRTFKIEIRGSALTALQKDNCAYVRATVTEEGQVFRDVGVHLKGMGSFRPLQDKPSFAVKFDKYAPDQTYCGMSKLMLNNASQDGTYLAELLGCQMFRDAGVPSPRVTHAFVEFNGRKLGLYVLVEAMNKEFLRKHFKSARGNLYEAYLQDIDQRLDQDNGSDASQADVKRLLEATRVPVNSNRWARLNEVLDVDRYVSHLVVELFTSHTDGYAMNRNNYRIYHEPTSGRFVFFGHGIDWAFANTGVSIVPPESSLVTRAVLQTPEGRRMFRSRRRELFEEVFRLDVWTNRMAEAVARLKAAARDSNESRQFDNCGNEMRNRLIARHRHIAEELRRVDPQPLPFDFNGVACLTEWKPKKLSGKELKGEGVMDQARLDNKPALHLRIDKGDTIVSWRTKVFLPEGKYRFEALARTAQVAGLTNTVERGNGAGLRASGDRRLQQLTGDTPWTPLQHAFEVPAGGDEKELVCELRANKGEAWFALESLRLVRSR